MNKQLGRSGNKSLRKSMPNGDVAPRVSLRCSSANYAMESSVYSNIVLGRSKEGTPLA